MDIKIIEAGLKDYKRKKSIIETTLLRIDTYKVAIEDPESFSHVLLGSSRELGMPRGSGGGSSVEIAISNKEKAIELLNEWIKNDKSRIYPYQVELEQLSGAMAALTTQERFIIELKYFESMFWNDIEISYNNRFSRPKNYITVSGLKKMNSEALELMAEILEPYYFRFKIKK